MVQIRISHLAILSAFALNMASVWGMPSCSGEHKTMSEGKCAEGPNNGFRVGIEGDCITPKQGGTDKGFCYPIDSPPVEELSANGSPSSASGGQPAPSRKPLRFDRNPTDKLLSQVKPQTAIGVVTAKGENTE